MDAHGLLSYPKSVKEVILDVGGGWRDLYIIMKHVAYVFFKQIIQNSVSQQKQTNHTRLRNNIDDVMVKKEIFVTYNRQIEFCVAIVCDLIISAILFYLFIYFFGILLQCCRNWSLLLQQICF